MDYYTKETLKARMKQLEDATGKEIRLIECGHKYAFDGCVFPWMGWYRTAKELIVYADGALAAIKFINELKNEQ